VTGLCDRADRVIFAMIAEPIRDIPLDSLGDFVIEDVFKEDDTAGDWRLKPVVMTIFRGC